MKCARRRYDCLLVGVREWLHKVQAASGKILAMCRGGQRRFGESFLLLWSVALFKQTIQPMSFRVDAWSALYSELNEASPLAGNSTSQMLAADARGEPAQARECQLFLHG